MLFRSTAVYPVYFDFHTWTIPIDSAWGNGVFINTTEDLGDHFIKLSLFRDNFEDANINNWTVDGGTWSATDKYLKKTVKLTSSDRVYANLSVNITPSTPFNMSFTYRNTSKWGEIRARLYGNLTSNYNIKIRISDTFKLYRPDGTTLINCNAVQPTLSDSAWHDIRVQYDGTGGWAMFLDEVQCGSNSDTPSLDSSFIIFTFPNANYDNVDNISVSISNKGNYTTETRDSGIGNEAKNITFIFSDLDTSKGNVSMYINDTLIQANVTNNTAYAVTVGYQSYNVTAEFKTTQANYTPVLTSIIVEEETAGAPGPDITNPTVILNIPLNNISQSSKIGRAHV